MPAPIVLSRKPLPANLLSPLPPSAVIPRTMPREAVLSQEEASALLATDGLPSNHALRRLMRYHSDTADRSVPLSLMRKAKALYEALPDASPLSAREASDPGDLMHMALWLYNVTGQRVLLTLCKRIKALSPDWMSTFHVFPQTKAVRGELDPQTDAYYRVHGETIASALKVPALQALFEGGSKNETGLSVGFSKLLRHHGAAHGLFNADPLLSGANPSYFMGDAIVSEALHSLHVGLWALGDPLLCDWLETAAHCALPAARGGQAANQLAARAKRESPPGDDFVASLWMATPDDGLAALCYAPSSIRWHSGGIPLRIEVETDYPFDEVVRIHLRVREAVRFSLRLRIPAWAEGASVQVDGEDATACEPGAFAVLDRHWQAEHVVCLRLPMQVRFVRGYHQSVSVMRGPLAYALPVSEGEPWNFALLAGNDARVDLSGPVPAISLRAAPVVPWEARAGVPAPPPIAPRLDPAAATEIRLVPYGRTAARIAQFPAGSFCEAGRES